MRGGRSGDQCLWEEGVPSSVPARQVMVLDQLTALDPVLESGNVGAGEERERKGKEGREGKGRKEGWGEGWGRRRRGRTGAQGRQGAVTGVREEPERR